MSLIQKSIATARLDLSRSLRRSRLAVAAVLVGFPPMMTLIAALEGEVDFVIPVIGVTTMMSGLLAVLLWATPIVHQELEGKTWSYVAVRRDGKLSLLLGRYLMAAFWTFMVCAIGMTIGIGISMLARPIDDALWSWVVLLALISLGSLSYSAIFLFIGVLFPKRSMVFAVAYMIAAEGILANFPAVVNQITMRHHLVALGLKWLDIKLDFVDDVSMQQVLGIADPTLQNVGILILIPAVLLCATAYVILTREYITDEES